MVASVRPQGAVGPVLIYRDKWVPDALRAKMAGWSPKSDLGKIVRDCLAFLPPEMAGELFERVTSCAVLESALSAIVYRPLTERGLRGPCRVEDYGVVSRKVVTTVGVGYIVDAFQNLVELENMKYHGLGTGSTAEAAADTALVTELTTEYTGNVRATGTTAETSATVYSTVATNTLDSGTPVLREHGVFSASSAGVLLDRSVFAAITLDGTVGDSLQTSYSFTLSAGG